MIDIKDWDGQQITEQGIYRNIPIDVYHGCPFLLDSTSISSSLLKCFINRPSEYEWEFLNRDNIAKKKQHYSFGQAAHHLILGEDNFQEYFSVQPESYTHNGEKKDWHNGAHYCKDWNEEQLSAGKQIVKPSELETIVTISEKLAEQPEVKAGILSGDVETSMFAKIGNIWLRSRPDIRPVSDGDWADIKFMARVDYNLLEKDIFNYGFSTQAGICRIVSRAIYGEDHPFNYFLICIEKTPPYDICIHELKTQVIDKSEELVRAALPYLEKCIERWDFPGQFGFDAPIWQIGVPPWAMARMDEQINHFKLEAKK